MLAARNSKPAAPLGISVTAEPNGCIAARGIPVPVTAEPNAVHFMLSFKKRNFQPLAG